MNSVWIVVAIVISIAFGVSIRICTRRLAEPFHVSPKGTSRGKKETAIGKQRLRILRNPSELKDSRVDVKLDRKRSLQSYKRNPSVLLHSCGEFTDVHQWIWAFATAIAVRFIQRTGRFADALVDTWKWRMMLLQTPSCVLYRPFPIVRPQWTIAIVGVATVVVILCSLLTRKSDSVRPCADDVLSDCRRDVSSLLLLTGGIVTAFVLAAQCWVTRNDYVVSGDLRDVWTADIRGSELYVGYEGIVFRLATSDTSEGWVLVHGHAQRAAFANLTRKRSDQASFKRWFPNDDIAYVGSNASPSLFALPKSRRDAANGHGFPKHPRYAGRRPSSSASPSRARRALVKHGTLVVAVQYHHGYFHWITERLPTLVLLLDTFLDIPESRLLVDTTHGGLEDAPPNRWPAQFLDILLRSRGVAGGLADVAGRIVPYRRDTVYAADRIVVASSVPTFACHRDLLVDAIDAVNSVVSTLRPAIGKTTGPTILLIKRTGAARRLRNFDEVVRAVQESARDRACVVDFDRMTVADQVSVCRQADAIVGVHGAGLANMVWARPGTVVVEIVPVEPPFFRYLFWHLATSLGLSHRQIFVRGNWASTEVEVDPSVVVDALYIEDEEGIRIRKSSFFNS